MRTLVYGREPVSPDTDLDGYKVTSFGRIMGDFDRFDETIRDIKEYIEVHGTL